MAFKRKPDTMLVRVDKRVWEECRSIMPEESNPAISRMLYRTSLLNVEKQLGSFLKKKKKSGGLDEL